MKYQIFISYRRSDSQKTAIILREKLKNHFNTFLDIEGIGQGAMWPQTLENALKASSVVLVLIGKEWNFERLHKEGDWVLKEIEMAMKEGKEIIPILVNGADMPSQGQLPEAIRTLPQFQGTKITDYVSKVDELIKEIKHIWLEKNFGKEARNFSVYCGGRYLFEKKLSDKKNYIVYLAEDLLLDRKVVIRIFKGATDPKSIKEEVLSAVRFASMIPNCVSIHEADFERFPHVVLDFMEGGSLRKRLRNSGNGLDHKVVAQILKDIGTSLSMAKTYHGKLKPSNILLNQDGVPYFNPLNTTAEVSKEEILSEFFDQKPEEVEFEPSQKEDIKYLAPEILNTSYKGLSTYKGLERIDQYMLGLLGCELLSGELPNTFSDVDELKSPPSYEDLRKRLHDFGNCPNERFCEILSKMTSPDPEKRYKKLKKAIDEISKAMIKIADVEVVRESYLRCLHNEVSGKGFFETFYAEFTKNENIKKKFDKFNLKDGDKVAMRRQYNHLQGAIFGLIEFSSELLSGRKPGEVSFLKHVAERHGIGDGDPVKANYFIAARPRHFKFFFEVLLKIVCGDKELKRDPFDENCKKSAQEKEKIKAAWEKVLKPGIDYMIDQI